MLVRPLDLHFDDFAYQRRRAPRVDVNDLVPFGPPLHAAARQISTLALARALDQYALPGSDQARQMRGADHLRRLEQTSEALALHFLRNVVPEAERRRVRTRGILE